MVNASNHAVNTEIITQSVHKQYKTELHKHVDNNSELTVPHGSPMSNLLKCLEDGKIHKIRSIRNNEMFQLCAELCFPCMMSKQTWKNNHQHVPISSLITVADDALALLILENNYLEWMELAKGREIDKSTRLTKYTHGGTNSDGTKKGWTLQGKLRFNRVFDATQTERENSYSKQMESRIKMIWYNENPKSKGNRNKDDASEAAKKLEMEEAQYVPRNDFDLET